MWDVLFSKKSLKGLERIKESHLGPKLKQLIETIRSDPFKNPPPYEKLIGDLSGLYSRRINIQHRLVYEVEKTPLIKDGISYEGYIRILSVWTHYED